mmetsp:Transcript_8912/g.21103  ORF Transcript_8912/g.21103 Transcript_8912/m.21103 type:complete len:344 (+) Transcript_8912:85-1116(+)
MRRVRASQLRLTRVAQNLLHLCALSCLLKAMAETGSKRVCGRLGVSNIHHHLVQLRLDLLAILLAKLEQRRPEGSVFAQALVETLLQPGALRSVAQQRLRVVLGPSKLLHCALDMTPEGCTFLEDVAHRSELIQCTQQRHVGGAVVVLIPVHLASRGAERQLIRILRSLRRRLCRSRGFRAQALRCHGRGRGVSGASCLLVAKLPTGLPSLRGGFQGLQCSGAEARRKKEEIHQLASFAFLRCVGIRAPGDLVCKELQLVEEILPSLWGSLAASIADGIGRLRGPCLWSCGLKLQLLSLRLMDHLLQMLRQLRAEPVHLFAVGGHLLDPALHHTQQVIPQLWH